ncbi:ER-derived vesicles protein 41 [Zancudomyces culisetae]|uniref:ER-derived vesicles protein 41 n=1 Tax=Zancudomyces culisetae TaxID=1213189 RepID=A0A1R1PI25_ZANCU|nr:ER-derived vesicles protein 41 [Zancudomyces culisetae]|eukprot:OMH80579.1 ER-derived vesicles protein 41 [Zancudomyces culisetae]
MPCQFLRIDFLDRTGNHKVASANAKREATYFDYKRYNRLTRQKKEMGSEEHVHDIIKLSKKKKKPVNGRYTGKGERGELPQACRFYGTIEVNKVKASVHVTAYGHGYGGQHVPHERMNFTHFIDEFSFGQLYPSLVNPLDETLMVADREMMSFTYQMNVVPTTYTGINGGKRDMIVTNQYAVNTYKSEIVDDSAHPGIYFNYDVEPIAVRVKEVRVPISKFIVRLCSVVGGAFVMIGFLSTLITRLMSHMGIFGDKYSSVRGVGSDGRGALGILDMSEATKADVMVPDQLFNEKSN